MPARTLLGVVAWRQYELIDGVEVVTGELLLIDMPHVLMSAEKLRSLVECTCKPTNLSKRSAHRSVDRRGIVGVTSKEKQCVDQPLQEISFCANPA